MMMSLNVICGLDPESQILAMPIAYVRSHQFSQQHSRKKILAPSPVNLRFCDGFWVVTAFPLFLTGILLYQ